MFHISFNQCLCSLFIKPLVYSLFHNWLSNPDGTDQQKIPKKCTIPSFGVYFPKEAVVTVSYCVSLQNPPFPQESMVKFCKLKFVFMDLLPLKTVRNCHYFCRFELGKMSIYEILLALDLTQFFRPSQIMHRNATGGGGRGRKKCLLAFESKMVAKTKFNFVR